MRPTDHSSGQLITPILHISRIWATGAFVREWFRDQSLHLLNDSHLYMPETWMSPTPASHADNDQPGQLLQELETRQDEVLEQLDILDAKLSEVLRGLGVTVEEEVDADLL